MHFVSVIHNPINDMTIHRSILNNSKYRIMMITRVPNLWGVIFLSWMFSVERGWYNPGLYDSLCNGLSQLIWGLLCHKQVSISWISNHNPSILCGMWLLMHAIDTCFWHQRPHNIWHILWLYSDTVWKLTHPHISGRCQVITVTSHECHAVWNHRKLDWLINSLFMWE